MLNTNYKYGDLKYYYQIYCRKQLQRGNIPLCYNRFTQRLRVMNLHDAIYTPRATAPYRRKANSPIQDDIRRTQTLKANNIQILDLDELVKLETETQPRTVNVIRMPMPKQSLLHRFLKLFR